MLLENKHACKSYRMETVIIVFSMQILKLEWEWHKIILAINLLFYSSLWRNWNNPTSFTSVSKTCLTALAFPQKWHTYQTSQEKVIFEDIKPVLPIWYLNYFLYLMLPILMGYHLHEVTIHLFKKKEVL